MPRTKTDNSKPVERRRRKAKGLKLWKQLWSPGRRRPHIWSPADLVTTPGPFFVLNLKSSSFDNGKPVERRRRKAKGLKSRSRGHDRQATENELPGFRAPLPL